MPQKKPSRAELEAENKFLREYRNQRAVVSLLELLVRWGGIVLVAYFAHLSIASLAGEETTADIGIRLFADVKLSEVFAVLFGSSGIVYGLRQRTLRRETVERLQGRVKELETERNPNRTSSRLTVRGDTNPRDK